jgi:DNA-binding beta-propeller fold protein YncE
MAQKRKEATMPSSDEVLATIPVEMEPRWVAIAQDGSRVYVTLTKPQPIDLSQLSGVAVINPKTNTVTATINVDHPTSSGFQPSGVVIAPEGRRAYISNWDNTLKQGVVNVIDTDSNIVIDTIALGKGIPTGVAITPNGRHVYVATGSEPFSEQGKVSVVDTATNAIVNSFAGAPFPSTVTITPNGDFVYVLDTEGSLLLIDTAKQQSTVLFGVLSGGRLAFSPDGRVGYFVHEDTDVVLVLDATTRKVVGFVPDTGITGTAHATDLAVTQDGRHVCVTQRAGTGPPKHRVWVIDTASRKVIGSPAKWDGSADGLAITPDGSTAYVADRRSRAVRVIPVQPH